ncbi:hypothetical protein RE428_10630 [Marinobacter nanhaiticus D15-8W]|uniref:Uncharacterized protein n=1 Tax=Marinobacter nanhaiticus D15-8W TaxID=626887 RepID=N6VR93_9GAMM|nr:hypothetical protein [Marinobacter nanhaiticus]ENO12705.1 hypothetical protein J057_14925 [Marinobacter nanhaiticus D15-8W]BES70045.1 hypothetical protein RE428_10630 [Marinobacter nanhaiticus D15-8W]
MKSTSQRSGENWQQRALLTIVLVVASLTLIHVLGPKSFLPHLWLERLSTYISIGLTVTILLWYTLLLRTGRLKPDAQWYALSRAKKSLAIIGAPLLIWWTFFMSIGYTIPNLWTTLYSESKIIEYEVSLGRGGGRHSCDYQLINERIDRLFFEMCIPKGLWYRLPEHPFLARFTVEYSSVGMKFTGVQLSYKVLSGFAEPALAR